MQIRVLTEQDASAFREVRLRALREHPDAFGASFEEERELPLERFSERLRTDAGTSIAFGALMGLALVVLGWGLWGVMTWYGERQG